MAGNVPPSHGDEGRSSNDTLNLSGGVLSLINVLLKNFAELSTRVSQAKDALIGRKPLSLEVDKVQNILKITEAYSELQRRLCLNPDLAQVPLIDNFLQNEAPKMQVFFKENIFIYDGGIMVAPPDYANELLEKAKEEKEKNLQEKINIIPIEDSKNYDEYKHKEKTIPKNATSVINTLNAQNKSLVGLSSYVDALYAEKRINEADKVRLSIYKTYNNYGLKFCNLYARGYLKSLLKDIARKTEETINANAEILKFINDEAKAIFFIHPYMKKEDIEQMIQQVNKCLKDGVEYVAIHSLGTNTKIAIRMAHRVTASSLPEYMAKTIQTEDKDKPPEFSKIWCRGSGIKIYSLIIENEKSI